MVFHLATIIIPFCPFTHYSARFTVENTWTISHFTSKISIFLIKTSSRKKACYLAFRDKKTYNCSIITIVMWSSLPSSTLFSIKCSSSYEFHIFDMCSKPSAAVALYDRRECSQATSGFLYHHDVVRNSCMSRVVIGSLMWLIIMASISKMWEPIYVFIMEYKCSKFYILLIRS